MQQHDQSECGVPKMHFGRLKPDSLPTQATRQIPAEAGGDHRHDDEKEACPISKLVNETPRLPQGETTANPMPVPKERTSVRAQDAVAPAKIALA
jgi:hypothetical protein